MNKLIAALILVSMALQCHAAQSSPDNVDANIADAKAAISKLAGSLQAELKSAMKAGGPVAAIGVCNIRALPITAQVGSDHDMSLSRVSLRNRNPGNAPNTWQTRVLKDFQNQKLAGNDMNSLTWSETTSTGDGREFRFMKAIPTTGVCMNCHGITLAPGISKVLADLYPADKATGYKEGDIRGAFVAVRKLP